MMYTAEPTAPQVSDVSAIILAGGRSARMGVDKATLLFQGNTLLERTVKLLRAITRDIVIAGPIRPSLELDPLFVPDEISDAGPLSGLVTGLSHVAHDWTFVCGCDAPLLSPALVRYLLSLRDERYGAIVPDANGVPQPLCAVYHGSSLEHFRITLSATDPRNRSLQRALTRLSIRWVSEREARDFDPRLDTFVNVNTPQRWQAFLRDYAPEEAASPVRSRDRQTEADTDP
ncbi:MAG TPA: molybdenum cofactor guanylyltransferase [Chloroflexota bacterium]|nr:molybdenum cofactor guanylyltransferase [Chloroflexota bacterium]